MNKSKMAMVPMETFAINTKMVEVQKAAMVPVIRKSQTKLIP